MSSTSRCFRRAYATISSQRAAVNAQAASAPLKIQDRRAQTEKDFAKTSDADSALTRDERRKLIRPPVADPNARGRIRGIRRVKGEDGKITEKIVGQRIYLPNIMFTLVRNQTPPGKPYNPYEATFRVPQSVTKTDIRSYLLSVYGVESTYIRTDNYLIPLDKLKRMDKTGQLPTRKAYKRAVVGLSKPFYYPLAVEDMDGRERWLREATLEDQFRLKDQENLNRAILVKFQERPGAKLSLALTEHWQTRAKIIRTIWERREAREGATRDVAKKLAELRGESGGGE